jgi:hypothetical protein
LPKSSLTVIYQIEAGCRRLLWVGKRRSEATLRRGLKSLGEEVVGGLRFVCSDMWKPYLKVLAETAGRRCTCPPAVLRTTGASLDVGSYVLTPWGAGRVA